MSRVVNLIVVYAEHYIFIVMLNVVTQNVVTQNVVAPQKLPESN